MSSIFMRAKTISQVGNICIQPETKSSNYDGKK